MRKKRINWDNNGRSNNDHGNWADAKVIGEVRNGAPSDVFPICLGTGEIGTRLDRQRSCALLDAYVELGGNFLDTAHNYGDWVPDTPRSACEKMIGAWLKERGSCDRTQVVLGYLISQPFPIIPIVGCQEPQQVADSLSAAFVTLTPEQIETIGSPIQSVE